MRLGRREVAPTGRARVNGRAELAAYGVLATAILVLLAWRASQVDSFYLDEWLYALGAEYMSENFPLGPLEPIPNWSRGPQRLYSAVLSLLWGPFSPPTAFTLSHLLNAVLLASAVWPAALLARRLIDAPGLRVLAVALATVIPWLVISAHLLTENLAFPLYLWSIYTVVRAAERPTVASQGAAIVVIGALTTCRLNLGLMFGVFVLAIVVAEALGRRGAPTGAWVRGIIRRRWPLLAGVGLAGVAGLMITLGGGAGLGSYANVLDVPVLGSFFGEQAPATRQSLLAIVRALLTGAFVVPVVLGLAAGLAALRGVLGRDRVVPALVLLSSAVGVTVLVAVTAATFGFFEERYVFYAYPPIALLAVAGLPRLSRFVPELTASGLLVVLALRSGARAEGAASGNFFVAPAGVFWTRVVEQRLQRVERALFGWLPGAGEGWLLVALAIIVMLAGVLLAARWTRLALVALLALCLSAQAATLNYDYDKLLNGTPEAPGGLAGAPDPVIERDDWIDRTLPGDDRAAIIPARRGVGGPWGGAEREQMFNRRLDAVVALSFTNAPAPTPPGYALVSTPLRGGLAAWSGPGFGWLVAERDDPRVQYGGRLVRRSESSPYALWRLRTPTRALWTASGLESDATVLQGTPVIMRFDRRRSPKVGRVVLVLQGLEGAAGPVRWTVTRRGTRVASGSAVSADERLADLRVPPCRTDRPCPPVTWRLSADGPVTPLALPEFGAPGAPRETVLRVPAVRLLEAEAAVKPRLP